MITQWFPQQWARPRSHRHIYSTHGISNGTKLQLHHLWKYELLSYHLLHLCTCFWKSRVVFTRDIWSNLWKKGGGSADIQSSNGRTWCVVCRAGVANASRHARAHIYKHWHVERRGMCEWRQCWCKCENTPFRRNILVLCGCHVIRAVCRNQKPNRQSQQFSSHVPLQ